MRTNAPTATVTHTVFESDGTTQRAAPYTNHARAGDVIRLSLTLSEAVDTAPTVVFVGKVDDPATSLVDESERANMVNVAGTNEWRATYTVETAMQNSDLVDGPFTFVATLRGNTGAEGTVTEASTSPPTIDRMVPSILSAAFLEANTIVITLSEPLAGTDSTIEGYDYTVTVPDGDDSGTDPDEVSLAATDPVNYDSTARTITLTLADGATADVVHTVTLPTELRDRAGIAFVSPAEVDATYSPPAASTLAFTVRVGSPIADKSGTYANVAGIGNTIRIDLDLDEDVTAPPQITLAGRGTTSMAMTNAGDADASTWRHDHVVDASHASATTSAPLDILIVATGTNGNVARITDMNGLASGTTVTLPEIDTVRPTATALTSTVRLEDASSDSSTVTTAGIGDDVRVNVTASEPLVTAVSDHCALWGVDCRRLGGHCCGQRVLVRAHDTRHGHQRPARVQPDDTRQGRQHGGAHAGRPDGRERVSRLERAQHDLGGHGLDRRAHSHAF